MTSVRKESRIAVTRLIYFMKAPNDSYFAEKPLKQWALTAKTNTNRKSPVIRSFQLLFFADLICINRL